VGSGEELDAAAVRKRLKKEVAEVVELAIENGWRVKALGHAVKLFCPCREPDHGQFSVSGTPSRPSAEARRVMRMLTKCPHFSSQPTRKPS